MDNQALLADIVNAYQNATVLKDSYIFTEQEIRFENNFEDGKSKLNSNNAFEKLLECPFVVERDYVIPILFSLFDLEGEALRDVLGSFIDQSGLGEDTFFYGGNVDFLFFFHNLSILKKAGYTWNKKKARAFSEIFNTTADLGYALEGYNNDQTADTANDVFSYIFAYCTSDENGNGGCKFNKSRNKYVSNLRGFVEDTWEIDGSKQDINALSSVFLFYGLTAYKDKKFEYHFHVGDITLMLNDGVILPTKQKRTLIKTIESDISERKKAGEMVQHFFNFGIVPLDVWTLKFYLMHNLRHYKNVSSFKNDLQNFRKVGTKDYEVEKCSDLMLLLNIRRPFIYQERADIIAKFNAVKSEKVSFKYGTPDPNDPSAVIVDPPVFEKMSFTVGGNRYALEKLKGSLKERDLTSVKEFVEKLPNKAQFDRYMPS